MNRKEYMQQLYLKLSSLAQEERDTAMLYYEEYFEDAGSENEERVIQELGSPEALAAQVIAENTIKHSKSYQKASLDKKESFDKSTQGPRKGLSALKIFLIAIITLPISLPLILIALTIIGAAALCGLVFVIVLGVLVVVFTIMGIFLLFNSLPVFFTQVGLGFLTLGGSLVMLAFACLLLVPLVYLVRVGTNALIKLARRIFSSFRGRLA